MSRWNDEGIMHWEEPKVVMSMGSGAPRESSGPETVLRNRILGRSMNKSDSFVGPKLGKAVDVLTPPKYSMITEPDIQDQAHPI